LCGVFSKASEPTFAGRASSLQAPACGGGVFQSGIDLSANQYRDAAQLEPENQDDQRAERAVKQPEMTEMTHV